MKWSKTMSDDTLGPFISNGQDAFQTQNSIELKYKYLTQISDDLCVANLQQIQFNYNIHKNMLTSSDFDSSACNAKLGFCITDKFAIIFPVLDHEAICGKIKDSIVSKNTRIIIHKKDNIPIATELPQLDMVAYSTIQPHRPRSAIVFP